MKTSKQAKSVYSLGYILVATVAAILGLSLGSSFAWAQTSEYQQHHSPAKAKSAIKVAAKKQAKPTSASQSTANQSSDQLNMGSLEKKYWSAKDTDFSVVENRKYTKAKKFALSMLVGPIINDPYNTGYNYEMKLNYYFSERYGVEFFDDKADLRDSQTTTDFYNQYNHIRPDFNRDMNFVGVGFNWVPFYAKMSVLGMKIIYLDMQFTPFIGIETYKQLEDAAVKSPIKNSFAYGFDIVQYFYFSKHFAIQADLQNRYFQQDIVSYGNVLNPSDPPGVLERSNTGNTTNFLMGVTYFF